MKSLYLIIFLTLQRKYIIFIRWWNISTALGLQRTKFIWHMAIIILTMFTKARSIVIKSYLKNIPLILIIYLIWKPSEYVTTLFLYNCRLKPKNRNFSKFAIAIDDALVHCHGEKAMFLCQARPISSLGRSNNDE